MSEHKRLRLQDLKQRQRLLQLLIFFVITIMVWVFFSLARSQRATKIDPQLRVLAKPLNPTIKEDVITELEQKRFYPMAELQNFPIYKVVVSEQTGEERIVTIDSGIDSLDDDGFVPARSTDQDTPQADSALNQLTAPAEPSPTPPATDPTSDQFEPTDPI